MNDQRATNMIICINCEARISRRALTCPKCGTKRPAGVYCEICHQLGPIEQANKVLIPGAERFSRAIYLHKICAKKLYALEASSVVCVDCGRDYGPTTTDKFEKLKAQTKGCPDCGSPEFLVDGRASGFHGYCESCRQPIKGYFQPYVEIAGKRYHEFCHSLFGVKSVGCLTTLALILILTALLFFY